MRLLKEVLGDTYGGPSISVEDGLFCLYEWHDAPVCMEILVQDATWKGFLKKIQKYKEIGYGRRPR